ncbi:MAG TPA: LytR C-terminal domain-containing protein [Nocardioidaceae bacterium]|nr:LytR C-terminal domain-containing protein [Nocardioidaceae bacterium]
MRRQQLVTATTMMILIGVLVTASMWGWKALFAPVPAVDVVSEDPSPTCTTEQVKAGQKIKAGQVKVSVFNSSNRSGLAGQTMDLLVERGFVGGDIGNAPSDVDVRRVEIWSTIENDARAKLVARQFGKSVKVRYKDLDLGVGVDVIVGDRLKGLKRAPKTLLVKNSVDVCAPVEPSAPAG